MDVSGNYAAARSTGTIVFIGAGRCHELPDLLAGNPARIILVEPQPRLAQELRRRTASHSNVEVVEATIAPEGAPTQLKIFNLPELSSLREPTGLYDVFPGLKVANEFEVEILAPGILVDRAELSPNQSNHLILDAPGEEAAILQTLFDTSRLAAFDRIDMICGRSTLFETDQTGTELFDRLADKDYDVDKDRAAIADSERSTWRIRRNHFKRIAGRAGVKAAESRRESDPSRTTRGTHNRTGIGIPPTEAEATFYATINESAKAA